MIDLLLKGLLGPLAIAALAAWALGRWPGDTARRWRLPAAVALGALFGLAWSHGWSTLQPTRHWHWLAPLAATAAILGAVGRNPHAAPFDRLALAALLAILAASGLVPGWKEIAPHRPWYVAGLAAYLALLTLAVGSIRNTDLLSRASLVLPALILAGPVAAGVSLTYAQLALAGASALAGALLLAPGADLRPLAPLYAVLVGGSAFIAALEPRPPVPGLLAVAAVPLVLPLADRFARPRWLRPALVAAALALAVLWTLVGDALIARH
jgi:hypothetical protein